MRAFLDLNAIDNCLDVLGGLELLDSLKVLNGRKGLDGFEVLVLR